MQQQTRQISAAAGPSRATLAAFAGVAVVGACASVAIKFMLIELAPLWAAAVRFLLAGMVLGAIMAWRGLPLPRGRALVGVVVFGVLNFGLAFAFIYSAMTEVTAGTTQVTVSLTPIVVVLLSAMQGVERLRLAALVGAVIAFSGTAIVFYQSLGAASLMSLATLMCGVLCIAQAMVAVKRFPTVDPVVLNTVGHVVGGAILLAISALTGEAWVVPQESASLISLAFLVFAGSVVFLLMVYVIEHWTASAAAYTMVVMPAITVPVAALMLGESVSALFLLGCAVIFAGLYVGVFYRRG